MRTLNKKYISDFPQLVKEWHHTKNGSLEPSELIVSSHTRVWWKCNKGEDHEWQTSASNRTKQESSCPFCAGQRATSLNNIAVFRPELLNIWDYEANNKLPTELMPTSNYTAHFRCSKNPSHKWKQKLSKKNTECPECFIETKSIFGVAPNLEKEWDYVENERLGLDPSKISAGSAKKAAWICNEDSSHRWKTSIRNRALRKTNCQYCLGRIATSESNLFVDAPEIAREWHPTKNKDTKPTDVKAGSGIERWWLCPKGHSYKAPPDRRTGSKGSGCPQCTSSTSSPEIRIYCELSYLFADTQQRAKINGLELDVWLPGLNLGIEYDGSYWHKDKIAQDTKKNQVFDRAGVKLIRMRAKPLKKISEYDILCENDDVTKDDMNALLHSMLKLKLVSQCKFNLYKEKKDFCNNSEYRRILSYLPSPVPENSLSAFIPESLLYWDYESNHPLVPENFTPFSNKKMHWRCNVDWSHKWEMTINQFSQRLKCPFCNKSRPSATYSLQTEYPEIASEWHPTKNKQIPKEFLPKSNIKVWWRCKKVKSHEWEAPIITRTGKKSGCPMCSGREASKENNLAKTHPLLLQSWDFSKNQVKPSDVKYGSNLEVHWLCSAHDQHRWKASVYKRTISGCPFCARRKTDYLDSIKHLAPNIIKEFLYFIDTADSKVMLGDLSMTSKRRARWQCQKCEHEYSLSVSDQAKGEGCKKCYPKYTNGTLATKRPDLAAQWHPSKNDKTPDQVTKMSDTAEFWWLCDHGHAWRKSLLARVRRDVKCSICEEIEIKKDFQIEALKYQTRWEFQKGSKNIYNRAHSRGWINELCSHMIANKKPTCYWTFENCKKEAKKYKGRTAFKKGNRVAYNVSLKMKWMNNFFPKA